MGKQWRDAVCVCTQVCVYVHVRMLQVELGDENLLIGTVIFQNKLGLRTKTTLFICPLKMNICSSFSVV